MLGCSRTRDDGAGSVMEGWQTRDDSGWSEVTGACIFERSILRVPPFSMRVELRNACGYIGIYLPRRRAFI